jgi:hypothetical protein
MPDDPCLFMRDWLKFHFGDDSVNTLEIEEKKEQPKPIGKADLHALREEVAKLKSQRMEILHFRHSFHFLAG